MSPCVCASACVLFVCIHVFLRGCMCVLVSVHAYGILGVRERLYPRVCLCPCVCLYPRLCACMDSGVCVSVCVSVCVCSHVSSLGDLEVDGRGRAPLLPPLQVVIETQLGRGRQVRQFLLSVERRARVPLETPAHTHTHTNARAQHTHTHTHKCIPTHTNTHRRLNRGK